MSFPQKKKKNLRKIIYVTDSIADSYFKSISNTKLVLIHHKYQPENLHKIDNAFILKSS